MNAKSGNAIHLPAMRPDKSYAEQVIGEDVREKGLKC
jgi:hypothetical protein